MGKRKQEYNIYLMNDDTNSYEYVVYVVKSVLGWDETQAINCATIAGSNGKCHLKSFDYYEDAVYISKVLESKNITTKILING